MARILGAINVESVAQTLGLRQKGTDINCAAETVQKRAGNGVRRQLLQYQMPKMLVSSQINGNNQRNITMLLDMNWW